jgi:hypothetical protein
LEEIGPFWGDKKSREKSYWPCNLQDIVKKNSKQEDDT